MIGHESWKPVKLGDVCSSITVGHVGSMANEYVESGVPFLRSQNVAPFRIVSDNLKYISAEFHGKLSKCALSPGDVVVVRTGYPGTAAVVPSWLKEANCADLVVIRPGEDVDPYYVVALFNSAWGIAHVGRSTVGVAQQHFNIGTARKLEVRLPPLPTQRRIASILSAYDDLIENNTKRIEILEEMARSLYREWFVHFRFPGHEKVKLVDSELGKIPEGWEVGTVGECCESVNYGYTASADANIDGPKFLRITDIVPNVIDWDEVPRCPLEPSKRGKYDLIAGDVVVARTGATVGFAKRINKRHPEAVYASYLVRFRPLAHHACWLGIAMTTDDYKGYISLHKGGAAQPNANAKVLGGYPHALPPATVGAAFAQKVEPIFDLSEVLQAKNGVLRQTRDLLLPKLISGEIDVDALDLPEAS